MRPATVVLGSTILAAAAFAALTFDPFGIGRDGPGDDTVKVTFAATIGDGKVWAGGMKVTYVIGTTPKTVAVSALPDGNTSKNSYSVTKTVKRGLAVSMAVTGDWPGKPITLQIRAAGVDPKPSTGFSPDTITIVRTVK